MDEDVPYGNPAVQTEAVVVVRAIYDAFARRDVEAAIAYFSPDIEWFPAATATRAGRTAPYRGIDGIREYFADLDRVWDDLRLVADDIRVAGGSVVVFGTVEGRTGGEEIHRRVLWTWQVLDGVATAVRVNDLG